MIRSAEYEICCSLPGVAGVVAEVLLLTGLFVDDERPPAVVVVSCGATAVEEEGMAAAAAESDMLINKYIRSR